MENIASKIQQYIDSFPSPVAERMELIRSIIQSSHPQIIESWSYGMPAYTLNKRPLLYFAAFKNHIGLYATPQVQTAFAKELAAYKQGKGSVQFPHNLPLPTGLIKKILDYKITQHVE